MRHFLGIVVAAVFLALSADVSVAQQSRAAPVLTASDYVGTWNGAIDWRAVEGYDNATARWELRPNGTFVDDYGDTGSWSVGADGYLSLQYVGGGNARYTGIIMGNLLFGTTITADGQFHGAFAMRR
jgi:hypothetical protein